MRDASFTLRALHLLNLDWEAEEFIGSSSKSDWRSSESGASLRRRVVWLEVAIP
jgi:hypothetical protein